jgi:hypothetical protein
MSLRGGFSRSNLLIGDDDFKEREIGRGATRSLAMTWFVYGSEFAISSACPELLLRPLMA